MVWWSIHPRVVTTQHRAKSQSYPRRPVRPAGQMERRRPGRAPHGRWWTGHEPWPRPRAGKVVVPRWQAASPAARGNNDGHHSITNQQVRWESERRNVADETSGRNRLEDAG
jgi:hypothetical protein